MKKIMFNDVYGLTYAVLRGDKTQTRRVVSDKLLKAYSEYDARMKALGRVPEYADMEDYLVDHARYQVGEIVAVAQSYKRAGVDFIPCEDEEFGCHNFPAEQTAGWNNKLYVRADLMPHRIRITGLRVERLHAISDEDCFKEGVLPSFHGNSPRFYPATGLIAWSDEGGYPTPQAAFFKLLDNVTKGTWQVDPFVFVYDFELLRK